MLFRKILIFSSLICILGCQQSTPAKEKKLFELIPATHSNIHFSNEVNDTGNTTIYNSVYVYNGGGVAVGDINQDSLPDIIFTGNQVPPRLYLNLGDFQFEEITIKAGIDSEEGWITGVTMADVNADGWLDIYICKAGGLNIEDKTNLLFINNQDLTFSEKGAAFGLDDNRASTHANFFDYDKDGDLDVYIVNHPDDFELVMDFFYYSDTTRQSPSCDRLMENTGNDFVDVSQKANITCGKGFGLSASVGDVNQDGWLDVFVANDFLEPDYLFINNQDKTFTESRNDYFSKVSMFSMGSHFSDINNDGRLDLMVADMEPEGHFRRKHNDFPFSIDFYNIQFQFFKARQYSRNMFFVGQEDGTFSELGEFANVARTDWSWSILFADYDNDGWKDLYVTNGTKREFNNRDYMQLAFDSDDIHKSKYKHNAMELIDSMPSNSLPNYIFQNMEDARFVKTTTTWGLNQKVNSQGAAYADFDRDGYLDLVVNNTDTVAFIYKNNGKVLLNHHFLKVKLVGDSLNKWGLGAKVWLYQGENVQFQEMTNVQGFQSSSEPLLHFGLGAVEVVDSLMIEWLEGSRQKLKLIPSNQLIVLRESDANLKETTSQKKSQKLFTNADAQATPFFKHTENAFFDFKRDKIIPRQLSKEGPHVAVGDVDQDGREDFYVGGAAGQAGALFMQKADGTFESSQQHTWQADKDHEDQGLLFFDANQDGALDLYVASGSNEFQSESPLLQDRLYLNDGSGIFQKATERIPNFLVSTSCVEAADFDQDGDLDLFVGGRLIPGRYPETPNSFILENEEGYFSDNTRNLAPELSKIGMVTDAIWEDLNQDRKVDLVLVGEYLPITIFFNKGNTFEHLALPNSEGWWNCIEKGDFDQDGDLDFIAGNFGYNSVLKCTAEEPITILAKDFDNNGSLDPVLFHFIEGQEATFVNRDLFCRQMPEFFNTFHTHQAFAKANRKSVFTKEQTVGALTLQTKTFASSYIENIGNGKFELHPLPLKTQVAPIYCLEVFDFDNDGHLDILLAGNTHSNFYEQGAIDASKTSLLKGDGNGNFEILEYAKTGLSLQNDIRGLKVIFNDRWQQEQLVITSNNDELKLFNLVGEGNAGF